MAIRVALRHRTQYLYDRTVGLSPQVVRLRPAAHCRTSIEAFSLQVEPKPHFINWQQDPFGNYIARIVFPEPVQRFSVDVNLIANLVTINPFDFFLEPQAEKFPCGYGATDSRDLTPYFKVVDAGVAFAACVEHIQTKYAIAGRRMVDVLVDINQFIGGSLHYDIRMEPGVFSPEETLERGHGSCRDFAWLLVNVLRALGIAARFVSGYSIQVVADQKPLDGPAGVSQDCTDLHAWAEAYLPGAGWVGLDATSGLFCGEGHIPLACTPDPTSAAPISGSFDFNPRGPGDEPHIEFSVDMSVVRIEDRPRPTRSYTEPQWDAILRCGDELERILQDSDVRLTLGGEPTFVSVDDMESPEWNTDALGPSKARLSDQLIRRLRTRFAPQGLITHGQGKWYPGEPLPRWAYTLYFRKDGEPLWTDGELIANGTDLGHTGNDARRFIAGLVERLGLNEEFILPAHEDVYYYLWRERRLPKGMDPFDSRLEDALERQRLRQVFEQGLGAIVGYTLPLRAQAHARGAHQWQSGKWALRADRLYLLPGDSPMGYRLPLDSLPWVPEEEREVFQEPDPGASFPTLGRHQGLPAPVPVRRNPFLGLGTNSPDETAPRTPRGGEVVRTALCVEPRGGLLHVFLAPVETVSAYLDLIAQLESTARELAMPIRIEGYPAPYHPEIQRLSVTPDPGVIEVNIHPATNWREAVDHTAAVYEEARLTRLGTDKFMVDGRHTGTGGGNHIVMGGATPADSPFLRRPHLLTSLVAFFNNHPALSYVFSGLFVGPTSQAPRLDEARNDSLYELEIARQILRRSGDPAPPWLVDRALRNLLVDITGNTHRAEFCIDKLFNPESPSGRLGLLELRSFEMPPDARMSSATQLLLRALVAHFWNEPYERPLVRWGTAIHDRFALPHYLWEDLCDAVGELGRLGIGLSPEWFLPHWEFRFPRLGTVVAQGIGIELRQALEPWHVLGEQAVAGGTARYVDSSVERVQIQVSGLTPTRYQIAVGKRLLPMTPTGRSGEYVAAVRYKAWKPPSSLHPTLDTHAPLVFDVVDTWNQRAIGGCSYYVSDPGGRFDDAPPTNGLAAESRRMARFFPFGHSPGDIELASEVRTLEYPLTLDLRHGA